MDSYAYPGVVMAQNAVPWKDGTDGAAMDTVDAIPNPLPVEIERTTYENAVSMVTAYFAELADVTAPLHQEPASAETPSAESVPE